MTAFRKRPGPRLPKSITLPTFEEAEERAILDTMRAWPGQMEARLKAAGYENFADGDAVLQDMFERKLVDPRALDALATVKWLAERGFRSAQGALRNYATAALENSALNPPASIRSYLINLINGLVPSQPPDPRDDLLRNLLRDIAVATMAQVAADRWGLPKLNSGRRRSAAWFVAEVMTAYGHKLTERQVRRLIQTYGHGLGARLSAFLLTGAVEQTI